MKPRIPKRQVNEKLKTDNVDFFLSEHIYLCFAFEINSN